MNSSRTQHGFTLVELAIAILVAGLIIAGGIGLYNRAQDQQRLQTTYDNMDAITQALSIFAETSGRLPCPTDPAANDQTFGWEAGTTLLASTNQTSLQVGAAGFPVGTCAQSSTGAVNGPLLGPFVGVVPFLALNLDDKTARDGWGRYFTYAVSPQFARRNDQSHNVDGTPFTVNTSQKDQGTVHGRCRTVNWDHGMYQGININAVKARFCCDDHDVTARDEKGALYNTNAFDNTEDIVINSAIDNAQQISPKRDPVNTSTSPYPYDFLTWPVTNPPTNTLNNTVVPAPPTVFPGVLTTTQSKILTPAFVLVSHGADGAGAFLANGTLNQYNMPVAGSVEYTNSFRTSANQTPMTFVDGPFNTTPGPFYFDHIVRWMTQDSIMAAHGALSCQYP